MSTTDADLERLRQLAAMLRLFKERVRYVDYRQAEEDCETLAATILQEYPRSELDLFSFTAIPRGGLIVLGLLSYTLGLRPDQLRADLDAFRPLVIVDDCSLTGARLAGQLARVRSREVVFVHLYSHPDLRRAVLDREDRVMGCLAARDLGEVDPPLAGLEERRAWESRWRERLGEGRRYWIGQPEPVCFAWSEPDRPFWNAFTERVESGWNLLPPHLCLKTRSRLAGPSPVETAREWQAPDSVVSGTFDGTLWLCDTRTDQVYSLTGVGADVWRLLASWGNAGAAVLRLRELYEVDAETAERDVAAFTEHLAGAGLLERRPQPRP
jgi:Coenzyme PQQ synthesis protein D (PqqD)